ncbi:MAG: IS607 family transposase [Gammaproteobacteria bacterium]
MAYVPLRIACKLLGVHPNTLRKWANDGRIGTIWTEGGHRRFDIDGYLRRGGTSLVCYCRVSSPKQKDDLTRQIAYMRQKWPGSEIVQDIGSGLNFKRKGLRSLLERALRGEKLQIVVAHRDRLARFGFELIEFIVGYAGGSVLVLDRVSLSPEAELGQDLCAIIHVFSCRLNGRRSHARKKDQALPHRGAETPVQALVRRVAACVQQDD